MKCYCCGTELRWMQEYTFWEYGRDDEEGIVSEYQCDNCGAEIIIMLPYRKDSENNKMKTK